MRTVILVAVMVTAIAIGCGGRDTLLRDEDGNTYVLRDMPDGRIWMTDNLSLVRPDSYVSVRPAQGRGGSPACPCAGRCSRWITA